MTIEIRALREGELDAADRVYRLAFGTLLGLPDPTRYRGDAELIRNRVRAYPDGAFVAVSDGEILGVSLANNLGSLGVLGPVAVHPKHWHGGIARRLLEPTVEVFSRWRNRMAGLFTFPDAGHLRLYQGFGFWPRYLVPVMTKPVAPATEAREEADEDAAAGAGDAAARQALAAECHTLAATIYPGLDLRREIEMIEAPERGGVVVVRDGATLAGFAICHCGKGSEGGAQTGYLKFALVRSGAEAPQYFSRLLAAAEGFARRRGAAQLMAGVSAGRHRAHRQLVEMGFRTQLQGVAMHRPWDEAYDRPEIYALDDWR